MERGVVKVDKWGYEVNTSSDACISAINAFYDQVLSYGRRRSVILEAPAHDHNCVLANILAAHFLCSSDPSKAPSHLQAAKSRLEQATSYEKAVFDAVNCLISKDRDDDVAFELHSKLLKSFPKDLASLKRAQVLCFYMARPDLSLNLVQQVLPSNQQEEYIYGMLAFPLLELGRMADAEKAARKGYEINKQDCWTHHNLCHVLQYECRFKEAVEFMESCSSSWDSCVSFMLTHNWWHVALCYMEGHSPVERLLEIYDHHIWKELEKVDAFGPETGCSGLCGKRVDAIEYYKQQIKSFDKRMALEQEKILKDSKALLPVAFVSFSSRWGAAVCAQTTQSKNPTLWLTNWAPEPRDIYWRNLAIPFVSLSIRKLVISLSVFALVFFYMIPIAFVQSLANLEGLERVAPFLRPVIELKFIKSFLQGFLPGLALKIFLYILPAVLMIMSKIEGHIALSTLERRTAAKYYYFMLVNVFLGSIVTGTAFQQLHAFLHQSPTQIPRNIGETIPSKATFFITYIMVDGWAAIAGEILRLKPLVIFHLKNMFLVKTERDREKATNPGSVDFPETLPSLQLYFLLGIVYAVVTPILLPFILVFFAFAYLVYRHQIINVYNQQYESAAAFWPHVHSRIIASLLISQLLLMGLLSTKKAAQSTPFLVVLPILTLSFHKYCKYRFEPAFRKYPLEEAMEKDELDKTTEPDINLKSYLADAYLHPIFRSFEEQHESVEVRVDKHQTHIAAPITSELTSPTPPHNVSSPSPPHNVHHIPSQYAYYQSSPPQYSYNSNSPPNYVYHSTSPPHYSYHNEEPQPHYTYHNEDPPPHYGSHYGYHNEEL